MIFETNFQHFLERKWEIVCFYEAKSATMTFDFDFFPIARPSTREGPWPFDSQKLEVSKNGSHVVRKSAGYEKRPKKAKILAFFGLRIRKLAENGKVGHFWNQCNVRILTVPILHRLVRFLERSDLALWPLKVKNFLSSYIPNMGIIGILWSNWFQKCPNFPF